MMWLSGLVRILRSGVFFFSRFRAAGIESAARLDFAQDEKSKYESLKVLLRNPDVGVSDSFSISL
jgi:hypothetical protein